MNSGEYKGGYGQMNRKQVLDYIREEYGILPDYPFLKSPEHAVLRHKRQGVSLVYLKIFLWMS